MKHDEPLSNVAFKFNLRRYIKVMTQSMWEELAGATPGDYIQGVDDRVGDPDATYTVLFRLRHPGRAVQLDTIKTRIEG